MNYKLTDSFKSRRDRLGGGGDTDYDGYFEHVERDRNETQSVIFTRHYQKKLINGRV